MRNRTLVALAAGFLAGASGLGATLWRAHAQAPADAPSQSASASDAPVVSGAPAVSIQDALQKPFRMPFAVDTPLDVVVDHLRKNLHVPVVLDVAALRRVGLDPEATVQLELEGVRLKTGLQLLLDQVDMTYRVVPEDNLLVITDNRGAEEPLPRILAELEDLHEDVHELKEAISALQAIFTDPGEEGAMLRAPTIIEEVPDGDGAKDADPAKPGDDPTTNRSRSG